MRSDSYVCVHFDRNGKVLEVHFGDKIITEPTKYSECEGILKEYVYKLRWCKGKGEGQGEGHGEGHGGSDPCCWWDANAGEERCWC